MKMRQAFLFFLTLFTSSVTLSAQTAYDCLDLKSLESFIEDARQNWNIPALSLSIASNTKAFTSAALAILVDEDELRWDERVTEYLQYFQLYDPYFTREMRVRNLLCHRCRLKTFSGETQKILYVNWDNAGPAGSINSSAHDMAQWIRLQINMGSRYGQQIISERQVWKVRTVHNPLVVSRGLASIRPSQHFSGLNYATPRRSHTEQLNLSLTRRERWTR